MACLRWEDPVEAFDKIDILNKSAQIYMSAQAMGYTSRIDSRPDGGIKRTLSHLSDSFVIIFHLLISLLNMLWELFWTFFKVHLPSVAGTQ